MKKKTSLLLASVFAISFFILGIMTISDYGMNWDEPIHFRRGHAYLNYFLSLGKTKEELNLSSRKSVYHEEKHQASYYLKEDCCHPVLNGMLFSASNKLLYEKFNILPDIEAYNFISIFLSTLLIFILSLFVAYEFGLIASFFASLSLFLYPLFLAETHFNVKDPAETVFFSLTLIALYLSVKKTSWFFAFLGAVLFGFAWGTKFNAVFLPFIFLPWLAIYYFYNRKKPDFKSASTRILLVSIVPLTVLIGFLIFFFSWPYLWQDPLKNISEVVEWYRYMGTEINYQPSFLLFGFNTYPLTWIIFTAPVIIILLGSAGIVKSFHLIHKKKPVGLTCLLIVFWLVLPIIRVSMPNTSIYGGIRHIMEFIPPLAILAGLGAQTIVQMGKNKKIKIVLFVLLCLPFVYHMQKLIVLHPNETIYFNEIAGGLKGAYEKKIPSAGFDIGNLYRQGLNWLNQNAEKNAKLSLAGNGASAVPRTFIRKDIFMLGEDWSAEDHKGEYVIGLTYYDWNTTYYYEATYLERFLKPIYEIKIDNVSVLKIWKNSREFVYPEYKVREKIELDLEKNSDGLLAIFPKNIKLIRMEIPFVENECFSLKRGEVSISKDGETWYSPYRQITPDKDPSKAFRLEKGKFVRLFPADEAKFVLLTAEPENNCLLKNAKKGTFWYIP